MADMEVAVRDSVNEPVNSVKEVSDPNTDYVMKMFNRRIEFHLERKPFKGFSDEGKNGFKLETLNPSSSDYPNKSSDPHRSLTGAVSGPENNRLDPELSFRISFRRIGAGLKNLGNTCFLNAVLQCLTYTEPLAAYLQSGRHKVSCRAAGFCALCAIQSHVSRALEATGSILVPKDLVSNLRCISRNFRNARQEDAHEYMMNLLESMHKCCLPSGVPSESPSAYEKSLIHKIFGGRLRSQVKCLQCSFCSNKFDPFLDLSLEILKADSLSTALENFTAQERLDGGQKQYHCQQCKQKVRALKQLTVDKAPEVLAIHLKRFASHAPGVKIDKKIEYPPTLDLKRYVTGPYDGNLSYTLYGVLVHAGWSTHSGHYYCFVRTTSGMWYCLDDNQVLQVKEGRVLQQKAYMLFYVRDQRYSAPKKTVDVLPRKDAVIKALGDKTHNNFNSGSKSESLIEKKPNGLITTISARREAVNTNLFNTNGGKNGHASEVGAPSEKSLIEKKPNGLITTISAQREAVNTNLFNTNGGKNGHASEVGAPSEKSSIPNAIKVNDHTQSMTKASLSVVSERTNGTNLNALSGCSSIKKDDVAETSLMVSTVISADGSPQNVTDGNPNAEAVPLSLNTVSLDNDVQNNNNSLKGSAKISIEGAHQPSTSNGDKNTGKDQDGTIYASTDNTSSLKSITNTMQDGGFSGVSVMHCPISDNNGQGAKQPKQKLRRKSQENKLHVVKKKAFKGQIASFHLSSRIMFGKALGRKKNNKRRRKHSKVKVDVETVLSDIDPSTSKSAEAAQNSPQGVKNVPDKKSDNTKNSRKSVKRDGNSPAKLPLEKTSAVAKIDSKKLQVLRVSSDLEDISTVAKTNTFSMPVGGLKDVPVPRWDGVEAGPSVWLESGGAEPVRIGYVGDEWDQEYDSGKRKKIRQPKLAYEGSNVFQEEAIRRSKSKKAKTNDYHGTGSQQPFRI